VIIDCHGHYAYPRLAAVLDARHGQNAAKI
jgi:hypothetical protein